MPVLAGHYEIDQFDDAHAIYIILAEPGWQASGISTAVAHDRPHILGSFYAHLCEEAPKRPPSRRNHAFLPRPAAECDEAPTGARQSGDGACRPCLVHGITTYVAIAGSLVCPDRALRLGMPRWAPRLCRGQPIIALRIDITPETPQRLSRASGSTPGMNVHRTAWHPSSRHRAAA
jgi:acyl-homoserine lactone synthase